ncbi:methyl-accepting chemotaxis protein [Jeongeupia sp. HS-3]|uniref:HAMP domain-containing methyl-accepting chemotaxis protein n=1 Tax=Jeongeupia sp. HS-3 TaxID=1009682 RepID=UPI0018A56057|nr:methyl-accepting chemotaxis protein [Jeongeupia sp. HS-3]BCL74496.1 methyl-accepting chemotaxis protein [Jeongeupia sp. HS-3]
MNIGQRLIALIIAAIAALVVVGVAGTIVLRQIETSVALLVDDAFDGLNKGNDINNNYKIEQILVAQYVVEQNPDARAKLADEIARRRAAIDQINAEYEKVHNDGEDRQRFSEFKTTLQSFHTIYDDIIAKAKAGDAAGAQVQIAHQGRDAAIATEKALAAIHAHNQHEAKVQQDAILASEASARNVMIAAIALAAIALTVFGALLYRSIRRPLLAMQQTVSEIEASLDFTRRVPVHGNDEIAQTVTAFNRLLERTRQSLKDMSDHIRTIGGATGEVARAAGSMSQNAGNTSEAATSMAATVEEVTVSISHIADRAAEADQISRESGRQAGTGAQVIDASVSRIDAISGSVREAAEQIDSLKERSAGINAVVGVIKDIADQTNLLALNAAIEAARAGETGRGFAVVADEVRKLAERTAVSTQEISRTVAAIQQDALKAVQRMGDVVHEVEGAVSQAREAGAAIGAIRGGSNAVVEHVADISGAIREQSAASNSIAQLVERIAQMSEASSSAAMQTANSAKELDRLAGEMNREVERYRL